MHNGFDVYGRCIDTACAVIVLAGPLPPKIRATVMPPLDLPHKRCDPVFSSNVADAVADTNPGSKKRTEPMCESQHRSEPIWNPDVPVQLAMVQIDAIYSALAAEQPPKARHRDAYRLIVWLTAIGFLITSVAIAFALDRTLL